MEESCLSVNRWCPEHCGSRSGLLALVKRKNTAVAGIHCIIHKKSLRFQNADGSPVFSLGNRGQNCQP